MPIGQKMRIEDEVRVKYVDDASVAVKLLIDELLVKKGELIIGWPYSSPGVVP